MRTTLLVCACLATLAGGVRVFAQDDAGYSDASDSAVYASAPGGGTGTEEMPCDGSQCGPSDDGIEYGPACQYPPCGPPRHPHAAGMAYYAKRAAQKADAVVYDGLCGVTHPCKTLHTIVENDIERKLKHCKCLGRHYGNRIAATRAAQGPWHGDYYYPLWGVPVALVVPPTCEYQTNYSWGVPAHRIEPIDHQFSRNPGAVGYSSFGTRGFLPPPFQPSDTNQFGVYYVRGPW